MTAASEDAHRKEEEDGTNRQYLGVAFYNFKYKKLVADKVFFRGPGYDSDK